MGKYQPLTEYLRKQPDDVVTVTLTFAEIEEIIGQPLPPCMYRRYNNWTNSHGLNSSQAWLSAGWQTRALDLRARRISFVRSPDDPDVLKSSLIERPEGRSFSGRRGKYVPLGEYLKSLPAIQDEVTLTFEQIGKIIRASLPPFASAPGNTWWANAKGLSHAAVWLSVGWRVSHADVGRRRVSFSRADALATQIPPDRPEPRRAGGRYSCRVTEERLVDSQVGEFALAAIRAMTPRELYSVVADRVQERTGYDRNRARNISYKAILRIKKVLARHGVKLLEEGMDATADGALACGFPTDQPIASIWEIWSDLPIPLRNCLGRNGILTVAQVLAMDPADFAELHGVGAKRVDAFVQLRETLRHMRLQEGVDAAHASGKAEPASPAPQTTRQWASLEELLRDVAAQVSANRMHTAEKDRNLEIWLSYHGLGPAAVGRTLDAVGAVHGLTRERVRQIVTRLTHIVGDEIARSSALAPLREALRCTIARCLGLLRAEDLARMLAQEMDWEQPPSVELVETLDEVLRGTPLAFGYMRDEAMVEHPDACEALRERVAEKAEALLREIHESEHILDFVYHLTQACRNGNCERSRFTGQVPCCGGERGETNLPCEYVVAVLSGMRPRPLDGDRIWGYWWTRLRIRRPKTEAVRAALHILGQPVHYSELTEFICEHNTAFSSSDERYVLHQLIGGEEYVLTGKLGTYGLREWGLDEYVTVGDRIEQLLLEHGRPMPQATVIRRLRAMGASENNIHAAIMQQRFTKDVDRCVGLSKWAAETVNVLTHAAEGPMLLTDDDEDVGYIL